MLKKSIISFFIANVAIFSLSSAASAKTDAAQLNFAKQEAFAICDFAATGLAEIVGAARQDNMSQADVLSAIDTLAAKMQKSAETNAERTITMHSAQLWKDNVPEIYQSPIYEKVADKQKFVQGIYESNFNDCMNAAVQK